MKITRKLTDRIWHLVGQGLSYGLGKRGTGTMCVQASVQAALEEEHNDAPQCVANDVRQFGITLNDRRAWGDKHKRGEGLRRFAIAQLGSDRLPEGKFAASLRLKLLRTRLPLVLAHHDFPPILAKKIETARTTKEIGDLIRDWRVKLKDDMTAKQRSYLWALSSWTGSSASWAILSIDSIINLFYQTRHIRRYEALQDLAELAVQVCIDLHTPGSRWLKEYESRSGEDLVQWLLKEKKKGEEQEAAATRFKELTQFLRDNEYIRHKTTSTK